MLNAIHGVNDFHFAVISTNRPHRVKELAGLLHPIVPSWYVTIGEKQVYVQHGAAELSVHECPPNISSARNLALSHARLANVCSIQCSDDLRSIKRYYFDKAGSRKYEKISVFDAVCTLLATQSKTKRVYGGTAVTNNPLNYTGNDVSFDKFVPCDLICSAPNCPDFDEQMALKEDLRYGGTFRCDNILCDFPHRNNSGGANDYRTKPVEDAVTQKMFKKWGNLIMNHRTRPGQISLRKNALEQEIKMRRSIR